MTNHIVSTYLGMSVDPSQWPAEGEKVVFLNKNGYDYEREQAAELFAEGRELTVSLVRVGRSSSTYTFKELPDREFNTVMFGRTIRTKTITLADQDVHTILAALRFYQEKGQGDPFNRSDRIHKIATNDGEQISMDNKGIDDLCQRINLG